MKKEAPEPTTLSGQKPISLILDEIEERATWKLTFKKGNPGAADWGEIHFGEFNTHMLIWHDAKIIVSAHNRTDVSALVKALRRAILHNGQFSFTTSRYAKNRCRHHRHPQPKVKNGSR